MQNAGVHDVSEITQFVEELERKFGNLANVGQIRIGTVISVTDTTLGMQAEISWDSTAPTSPGVACWGGYLPLVGDIVRVIHVTGGGPVILGPVAYTPGLPNIKVFNGVASAGNTITTVFADVTGVSVTITKRSATTGLNVRWHSSAFVAASNLVARWGVRINGTDYTLQDRFGNIVSATAAHEQWSGEAVITGIPAGSQTCQMRWARASGTGTLTRDTSDWSSLAVTEVMP